MYRYIYLYIYIYREREQVYKDPRVKGPYQGPMA